MMISDSNLLFWATLVTCVAEKKVQDRWWTTAALNYIAEVGNVKNNKVRIESGEKYKKAITAPKHRI